MTNNKPSNLKQETKAPSQFTPKGKFKVLAASITAPENAGLRFLVNVVGQSGKFEAPLDKILTKRWDKARSSYKTWYAEQQNFKLGAVRTDTITSDVWQALLLCKDKEGKLDEKALEQAVKKLGEIAVYEHASLHVSSLLMEEFPVLAGLLEKYATSNGLSVYQYNEPV